LAFFGLAYPFLVIINLAFVLFWWWRRNRIALISAVIILAGCGNLGRYFQVSAGKKLNGNKQFSLLTYNVRLFNHYEWQKGSFVGDSILKFIANQKPDIVCLQEFITLESTQNLNQAHIDSLLSDLPEKHILYTSRSGAGANYGIAMYTRFPIVNRGDVLFKDSYNSGMFTDVVYGDDTLRIFNVHLQSVRLMKNNYRLLDSLALNFPQMDMGEVRDISGRLKKGYIKRAMQVDILSGAIKQSPYPVIVCGDFNDTPVSYTYHQLRGDLKDAFIISGRGVGNTYRGNFPSYRIDFIFHSRSLHSENYHSDKINLSDHYPIGSNLMIR
jgi:endonuclease/exonuclease/phosphatase family metal-dependent hydrolase